MPSPTPTPIIVETVKDTFLDLVGIIVPTLVAVGAILKNFFDHRKDSKNIELANRKVNLDHETGERSAEMQAAKEMSKILVDVIDPLAKRIQAIENELINKQDQILDLTRQIIELEKVVHQKDMEIEALETRYNEQVMISNEQIAISSELKRESIEQKKQIAEQQLRIKALETELQQLKGNNNGVS